MRVAWTPLAIEDLNSAYEYIAAENPSAAAAIIERIRSAVNALRAHPEHPTVSTPLTWEELDAGSMHPTSFTPQVVFERLHRMGDLFTPVLQADQRIDKL